MAAEMPVFDESTKPSDAVRDALIWTIAEVEAAIAPGQYDEIRYLRSKKEFRVRRGTSTVTLYFSGSKWNGTGHGIWVHTGMAVRDSRLGGWRRAHPAEAGDSDDFVDHVQLASENDTVVWQPAGAPPNPFAGHVLAELPGIIVRDLADAFDTYSEPLSAVQRIPANHLNALNTAAFSEWAFALDRPDHAEEVIQIALRRRPILIDYVPAVAARLGVAAAALVLPK